MTVQACPIGVKPQFMLASGLPAVGYQLFFYAAGSNTKQNTFTSSTGLVANSNPIALNSLGQPSTEIWFTANTPYKIVYAPVGDSDPPASAIWTIDNLTGIPSTPSTLDEWVASGLTPTYVDATHFTLVGDQTSTFQVGRRLKSTITAGTGFHTITASSFGAGLTTVTVNGTSLDSGLSAVSYGLLSETNTSIPSLNGIPIGQTTPDLGTFTTMAATTGLIGSCRTTGTTTNCPTSGTPASLFDTSTTPGRYEVYAYINGAVTTDYTAKTTILHSGSATPRLVDTINGALLTLTLSGSILQATQSSGAAANVIWSYLRIV